MLDDSILLNFNVHTNEFGSLIALQEGGGIRDYNIFLKTLAAKAGC